jgi:hypothetical protein
MVMTIKVQISKNDDNSGYYCPIHPEIIKDKPGACTRCGFTLVKDSSKEEW